MKRKNKRLSLISAGMLALAGAVALILMAFEGNIVFFYSPTEIVQKQPGSEQRLRLGGLVEAGSVVRPNGSPVVTFNVTDLTTSVSISDAASVPRASSTFCVRKGFLITRRPQIPHKKKFFLLQKKSFFSFPNMAIVLFWKKKVCLFQTKTISFRKQTIFVFRKQNPLLSQEDVLLLEEEARRQYPGP